MADPTNPTDIKLSVSGSFPLESLLVKVIEFRMMIFQAASPAAKAKLADALAETDTRLLAFQNHLLDLIGIGNPKA